MISTAQLFGIDDKALTEVCPQHKLHPQAAAAFVPMQQAAHKQGIDLQIASSFRNFERQLLIWNEKWQGKRPLYDRQGQRLNTHQLSDTAKVQAILIWSALPGASRHHWGTELDVYDKTRVENTGKALSLITAEYEQGGPCHALNLWLDKHAENHGFNRPYLNDTGAVAREPWHLSHFSTANAFENVLTPDALSAVIESSAIEGKTIILKHLHSIIQHCVYNRAVSL